MRGFERVVALPDSKDIEFPQPLQLFPKLQPSGRNSCDLVTDNQPLQLSAPSEFPQNLPDLQLCG
jgi:hypothetical protein